MKIESVADLEGPPLRSPPGENVFQKGHQKIALQRPLVHLRVTRVVP